MISEDVVQEILASGGSLEDKARRLIAAANEGGGRDNITVVLFRLESDGDEGEDQDTLGGQATQVGVNAETVRAAVRDAEGQATVGGAARTVESPQPDERPSQAQAGREHTRVGRTLEGGVPSSSPTHARRAPPVPVRRRIFTAVGILLVLLAAIAVVFVVNRQFWFVGTDSAGHVALYQGLPYELPLGIDMYSQKQVTAVPAAAIADRRQRNYVLDHHPRGHDDSADLVRQIESNFNRP
jgi:hypothetical protein